MALIKCPECGKEVSDAAKSCPHCGYNLKKQWRVKNKEKDNNKNGKVKWLLLAIILLVIVIVIVLVVFPKHEWIEADCTNPITCSICGKTKGEALQHDFSEATCTEAQVCMRCGERQGKPLGHVWGDYTVIKDATCSVAGEEKAICTVCGESDVKKISTLSHTAGEWIIVTEPSFAEDGENVQYCEVCNKIINTEKTSLPAEEKEALFKEACERFAYSDYARDPDAVKGNYCKTYGEVSQVFVSDDGKTLDIRINITKKGTERVVIWTDDIWVVYTKPEGAKNVLEGDMITFYGIASGTCSYETVSGGTRTVPLVYASYVDIGKDNTKTQTSSNQPAPSQTTTATSGSSISSGFAFSADVFCQEEQGLYVKFVGVDDPAGTLQANYIGIKFMVTNNNSSKVTLLVRGFTINDCSFETSGGAAEIAAGANSFLTCTVKKDKLAEYGITSIDKLSGYIWVSDIGYTNTFTINTK